MPYCYSTDVSFVDIFSEFELVYPAPFCLIFINHNVERLYVEAVNSIYVIQKSLIHILTHFMCHITGGSDPLYMNDFRTRMAHMYYTLFVYFKKVKNSAQARLS